MFRQIPGHARVQTIPLAAILAIAAYWATGLWRLSLGLALVVLGDFLWSQATHLHQENHSGPPPTWLEKQQQRYRPVFVLAGITVCFIGLQQIVLAFS